MASLTSIYIKKETLKQMLQVLEQKGENGLEVTVSQQNETNQWGQNASMFVSQTKEQRDTKTAKFYLGNGKVFWTDGVVKVADKVEQAKAEDLPF